jgi:hypothetical protein
VADETIVGEDVDSGSNTKGADGDRLNILGNLLNVWLEAIQVNERRGK